MYPKIRHVFISAIGLSCLFKSYHDRIRLSRLRVYWIQRNTKPSKIRICNDKNVLPREYFVLSKSGILKIYLRHINYQLYKISLKILYVNKLSCKLCMSLEATSLDFEIVVPGADSYT